MNLQTKQASVLIMKPVLIIIVAALCAASAFNSEQFLEKFCERNKFYENLNTKIDLYCSNVKFSPEELGEIQTQIFAISNEKRIVFEGGDLGVVNVNFLKKFPKTLEIMFSQTSMKLIDQKEIVDSKLPLETIYMSESRVHGNDNINLFNSLPKLTQFSLGSSEVDSKTLSKKFLGSNPHLSYIEILETTFNEIDDDAFEDIINLDMLNLVSLNLTSLPSSIKQLKNLKWVNLTGNKLSLFPKDSLPSSLEDVNVQNNVIHHISRNDFKSFPLLTKLSLGFNGIEKLNQDTFEDLEKLAELDLEGNRLTSSSVSRAHFDKLKNLKSLNLDSNHIDVETSDLKDYGIVSLKDQEVAVV